MKKSVDKNMIKEFLKFILVGFLLIICTFPNPVWVYSVGIDPPLSWVFNYLFKNGLTLGKHIVFPHGSLAFFMYPLPENILLSTIVDSVLKLLLFYNLILLLSKKSEQTKWLLSFAVAYFISIIAGFNQLILANLILLYCNAYPRKKRKLRYIAYFLTAFAFYVKAYVAIMSGVLFVSFIAYNLYRDKNIKTFLFDCLTPLGLILLFWLVMYGTFKGFFKYIWGMLHLVQDNSSAAAFYPYNNWLVVGLLILTPLLLILFNRTRKFGFYAILIGLSLFASWKHGMARQDIYHAKDFYVYFLICSVIFLLYYKKKTFINLSIILFANILFLIICTYSVNYKPYQYEIFRANNFIQFVSNFNDLKKESEKISQEEISVNKLPNNILDSIGNSTVDVYPWDYSVIPANNLNWQPRVVINSYASYTSWLDKQNALHFSSENAPEYLIIEKLGAENVNGGQYSSIDSRYLLNDEPQTIIEILKTYEYWYSDDRFLIVRKRGDALNPTVNTSAIEEKSTWSEWQNVPTLNDGQLLRAKMSFNKSFLQRIKSFLYKDEQFWIYLKLDDNSIHKYRIVPKNASDGLWINPYVFNSDKALTVKEIMFKASNENILKKNINITWETYNFDKPDVINNFFCVGNVSDSTIFQSANSFEEYQKEYWSETNDDLISKDAFEGENSFHLKPRAFSGTFTLPLDSINAENIRIEADFWVKTSNYKKTKDVSLIMSIDCDGKNTVWEGISIDAQLIDRNKWSHILNHLQYKNTASNCTLKAYIWNNGNSKVLIDEFRIRISETSHKNVDKQPKCDFN
ncbi:MAG: hypothetical protein PHP31_07420 [Lentimicrobiaceae bacterium]|nr:hypothetical protein [Lentimicrobiaceae bacterium]